MYEHVLAAAVRTPWAIDPDSQEWAAIRSVLSLRAGGGRLSDSEIRARVEEAQAAQGPRRGRGQTVGSIAVIPIYGVIMPRANLMTEFSGGATVQGLRAAFREAMADESIGSILFDVDSPGGQVGGIEELAAEIRAARGRKPMAAISNGAMASAAYYLGAQADEVIATPSSLTGSIGVYTVYVDESRAADAAGLDVTIIKAGKFKAEGAFGPLSPEAAAAVQQRVDDFYGQFVGAVAKARGVTTAAVRSGYGEGRALTADRAKAAGLVDRVDTFDGAIQRLASGRVVPRGTAALDETLLEALDPADAAILEEGVADGTVEVRGRRDAGGRGGGSGARARARGRPGADARPALSRAHHARPESRAPARDPRLAPPAPAAAARHVGGPPRRAADDARLPSPACRHPPKRQIDGALPAPLALGPQQKEASGRPAPSSPARPGVTQTARTRRWRATVVREQSRRR
jgi:signal peptide peptidase SppA